MNEQDVISRQWLFDRFNEIDMLETYNDFKTVNTVINEAPAVEVAPVIHAHWVLQESNGYAVCSHCHRGDHVDPIATHCRYCGAKMDEKE